ncbi:MAG: DUF3108 domain-containing protein [Nitrospirota bacterium]
MRERSNGKKLWQIFIFLSICCLLCAICPAYASDSAIKAKFVYNIYWSGIKAGEATLSYANTPEGITITSTAQSAPFISIFYKVDDLSQSILAPDGHPNKYIVKIREGSRKRDKVTYFSEKSESNTQKVIYIDKLKNESVEFNLEKQAFDPLSAAYEISRRKLRTGRSEYIDIFDNKKVYNTEVQVLGKERITTSAGGFDTIVIKPLLKSEGVFLQKGEIYIWLTDDEKRLPVMLKSKVKIGSFTAELAEGVH